MTSYIISYINKDDENYIPINNRRFQFEFNDAYRKRFGVLVHHFYYEW